MSLRHRVCAVTIYRSGATVTRTAEVPAAQVLANDAFDREQQVLRIDGLPCSLDDSSVRCRIVSRDNGAESPTLTAVGLQVVLDIPRTPAGPPVVAAELKDARVRVEQLLARSSFLKGELGQGLSLDERAKPESGKEPLESPLQARLALLEFFDEYQRSIYSQYRIVMDELEVVQKQLNDLEIMDKRSSSARKAELGELRKCVLIRVQGAVTGETQLQLEYFVPGACWAPAYTVKFRDDWKEARLYMRAMVAQRSGEDWAGVALTLSTAEAQRWSELPKLMSKRVGRVQEDSPEARGWRLPPLGTDELYRDYDREFGGLLAGNVALAEQSEISGILVDNFAVEDFDDDLTQVLIADEPPSLEPATIAPPIMVSSSAPATLAAPTSTVLLQTRSAYEDESEMTMVSGAAGITGEVRDGEGTQIRDGQTRISRPHSDTQGYSTQDNLGAPGGVSQSKGLIATDEQLNYANLRMPPANCDTRGVLRESSAIDGYAEYLQAQNLFGKEDLQDLLDWQSVRSHEISSMPIGHHLPWAEEYDFSYRAQRDQNIASDGQFHNLPILESCSVSQIKHVAVPRESTDVFRSIQLNNPFVGPLLAGPIDVYWRGEFLLTSNVKFTAPKATLSLGLGVDQAIKVARNSGYREETVGLMGGGLLLAHDISIEVANKSDRTIVLEVRERIPTVGDDADDIKIDVQSVDPEWHRYEQLANTAKEEPLYGGYHWNVEVAPGNHQTFVVRYDIKIPSKYELRGGNRREWS